MKIIVKDLPYLIPSMYQIIRDEADDFVQDPVELSKHFDDVYKLYLRRLGEFEMSTSSDNVREGELTTLLSELIRVKRQLNES